MKKLIKLFLKAVSKMGKSKKDKGASNGQDSTFYFAGKKKPEEDEDDQEEDDEDELQVSFISVSCFCKNLGNYSKQAMTCDNLTRFE